MKLAAILLPALVIVASCTATPTIPAPPYAQDLVALGVEPASSIESRIVPLPVETIQRFQQFSKVTLANRGLTLEERRKLIAAFDQITPLQRRIVQERLRSISFAEGLPANAQTSRVTCAGCTAFDLVINARILDETISQFATRKERTLWDASDSNLNVSIDAGSMSALVFILLHETTHMVDMTAHLTPQTAPGFAIPDQMHTPLSRGVWAKANEPAAPYNMPLFASMSFRTGKPLPISEALGFYDSLAKTPFPSSYAAFGTGEDIAELVALSELTGRLKQPFRIELRDGACMVASWEPMKSPLVRSRLPQLERFRSPAYELPPPVAPPQPPR